MLKLEVEYCIDLVSAANDHGGLRKKMGRTKRHREAARGWLESVSRSRRIFPELPCTITLTRYGTKLLDENSNLGMAFKATMDGIACKPDKMRPAGFLQIDDADPRITWICKQEKISRSAIGMVPGQVRVKIEIEWEAS